MNAPLDSRSVVVVGASSGIGRGVAIRAVRQGAKVILAARRAEALEEAASEAGGGLAIPTDLRSEDSCEAFAQRVDDSLPPVDLVLISAGTAPLQKMRDCAAEDWATALETNVVGINRVIAALFRCLSPCAVVAVVSSDVVGAPRSHLGAYGASKAALEQSIVQWREEHPRIRFMTVSLGATVPTEFGHAFDSEVLLEAFGMWTASGRNPSSFMDTEEVCELLVGTLGVLITTPSIGMPKVVLSSPAPPETDQVAALDVAQRSRQAAR